MLNLITPPGMLLTVALLAIYSAYAFGIGTIENSMVLLAAGIASLAAAYGTAMLRPWSQYFVYVLATGFVAKLSYSVYAGVASGYFAFQFGSVTDAVTSLGPSVLMALLSCLCCFLVYRHFKPRPVSSTN